jgi:hypothetical protein
MAPLFRPYTSAILLLPFVTLFLRLLPMASAMERTLPAKSRLTAVDTTRCQCCSASGAGITGSVKTTWAKAPDRAWHADVAAIGYTLPGGAGWLNDCKSSM